MKMPAVLACIFAMCISSVTSVGTHWIVMHEKFTPGLPFLMTFGFYNTSADVLVQVDLLKDDHHRVASLRHNFTGAKSEMIQLQIPNIEHPTYTLLINGLSGVFFQEEATIKINSGFIQKASFIQIQTDKGVYRAGQTVRFRVFGVSSDMMVYNGSFTISVNDPKGNEIKKLTNVSEPRFGVVEDFLIMDTEPVLGNWSINASTTGPVSATSRRYFVVEKYVPQKFHVNIDVPSYVLTSDKEMHGKVTAMYAYGKPVIGAVRLFADTDYRDSPWKYNGDEVMLETNFDINGEAKFTVPFSRINDGTTALVETLSGHHLQINVSVTESINNITRNTTAQVLFYKEPYKLAFQRFPSRPYFEPGLPYVAKVEVTQANGFPIMSSKEEVRLLSYETDLLFDADSYPYKLNKQLLSEQNFTTPPTGILEVAVDTPVNADYLVLEVFYQGLNDTLYLSTSSWLKSDTNIEILKTSSSVVVGKEAVFDVKRTAGIEHIPLFYAVIAKDQLVHSGCVSNNASTSLKISFPATDKMTPYGKIVVYYFHTDTGTWKADALYFDVEYEVKFKNKVSLLVDKDTVEPGVNVSLSITTDPNSLVSLLAVDQRGSLLVAGNVISQANVLSSLKLASSLNNASVQDPAKVMKAAGLLMLTDTDSVYGGSSFHKRQVGCNPVCDYKGKQYSQGQKWQDGCQYECTCEDASIGYYRCKPLCPQYSNLPSGCTLATRPGECCATPQCAYTALSTMRPSVIVGGAAFCVYKGQYFMQDETWKDGCSQSCTCTNADNGMYSCRAVCLNWNNLPPMCHLEDPSPDLCCQQPRCPSDIIINIPITYMYEYPGYNYVGVSGLTDQSNGSPTDQPTDTSEYSRDFFPETWLWTNITVGESGNTVVTASVPDTISSWYATAFSVNRLSGLGVTDGATKITTFRPFFVNLNLPSSVVRGEEVVLQANVFNNMGQDLDVVVTLERSPDFKVIHNESTGHQTLASTQVVKHIHIKSGHADSIYVPVVASEIGIADVTVKAQTSLSADTVQGKLIIKAEGTPLHFNLPLIVNEHTSVDVPLSFPQTFVADSQKIQVSAISDTMGPTLKNMKSLLRMPTGCGEQTVTSFAPNVFAYNYLKKTNRLKQDIASMALANMNKGYQRELKFQRNDGSFSIWGQRDRYGSLWLTAFVLKSFCQAKEHIFISDTILKRAANWILRHQNYNGQFRAVRRVNSTPLREDSSSYGLTAFVLIAFAEMETTYSKFYPAVRKAEKYLENAIRNNKVKDAYELAIISYALSKSGSTYAHSAYSTLENFAIRTGDGKMFWNTTKRFQLSSWEAVYYQSPPLEIETASYALLYLINSKQLHAGYPILRWLISQRNSMGGFRSTQDTVIGLQALSEYGALFGHDLDLTIDVVSGSFQKQMHIGTSDATVLKLIDIPHTSFTQNNNSLNHPAAVSLQGNGTGASIVQVSVSFNVESEVSVSAFNITPTIMKETLSSLLLQTCARYLPERFVTPGMAVIEIDILSGFVADMESLDTKLEHVRHSEIRDEKTVVLYYDQILPEKDTQTCATIKMIRTDLVAKNRPAAIRVFDYYKPDNRGLMFYESKLLRDSSICDIGNTCSCP